MNLDGLACRYLLDDNQAALATLLRVQKLALGMTCPHCDNADENTIQASNDGTECFCEACEEYFSPGEEAAELAAIELGINLEVNYR